MQYHQFCLSLELLRVTVDGSGIGSDWSFDLSVGYFSTSISKRIGPNKSRKINKVVYEEFLWGERGSSQQLPVYISITENDPVYNDYGSGGDTFTCYFEPGEQFFETQVRVEATGGDEPASVYLKFEFALTVEIKAQAKIHWALPSEPEKAVTCIPFLNLQPSFEWNTQLSLDKSETTGSPLQYSGSEPDKVTVKFPLKGNITDPTDEILEVSAEIAKVDGETAHSPKKYGDAEADNFDSSSFTFNEITLQGHGHHLISVKIVNAAKAEYIRYILAQVDIPQKIREEINQKEVSIQKAKDTLNQDLLAINKVPENRKKIDSQSAGLFASFDTLVKRTEAEIRQKYDEGIQSPAVRFLGTEILDQAPEIEEGCKRIIHVVDLEVDKEETEIEVKVEASSAKKNVKLEREEPDHFVSKEPKAHLCIPKYKGEGSDYKPEDLKKMAGLQHDPTKGAIKAIYDEQEAEVKPVSVSVEGPGFGYCPREGSKGQAIEFRLRAEGEPGSCDEGSGQYEWKVVEKPKGASTPSIEGNGSEEANFKVLQAGFYRFRVYYHMGDGCKMVYADHVAEFFDAQVMMSGPQLSLAEASGSESYVLSVDDRQLDLEGLVYLRNGLTGICLLNGEASLSWNPRAQGSLSQKPAQTSNSLISGTYQTQTRPASNQSIGLQVSSLDNDEGQVNVKSLNIQFTLNFQVVEGQAMNPLTLYDRNWNQVGQAQSEDAYKKFPDGSVGGFNFSLSRSSNSRMNLQIRPVDQFNNPLPESTPVNWRLFGGGKINTPEPQNLQQGTASAELAGGFTGSHQMLRVTVGERSFFIGNPLVPADIQLSWGTPGLFNGKIYRNKNTKHTQVVATVKDAFGEPMKNTEVQWSISKGSVQGSRATVFSTTSLGRTNSSGITQATLSDQFHATDGTLNKIHNLAWGKVTVTAMAGQPGQKIVADNATKGSISGHFNDSDMIRRPRNIWPTRHFMSQKTLAPIDGGAGASVKLEGTANDNAYVDIVQDRQLVPWVNFNFAPGLFGAGNNLPGKVNSAVYPRPILFDFKISQFRVGFEPIAPNTLRMYPSTFADLLAGRGIFHSVRINGLTNFEVSFDFSAGPANKTYKILEGKGADDAGGSWYIERSGGGRFCSIQAHFGGSACATQPAANATTRLIRIPTRRFVTIKLQVSGDPKTGVNIRLTIGMSVQTATTTKFNWLSGNYQRVRIFNPAGSPYDMKNLDFKGEINSVMNMRDANGVLSPRGWVSLDGSGEATINVRNQFNDRQEGQEYVKPTPPTFTVTQKEDHIQEFGSVITSYCSSWDFDETIIPAMSDTAIRIYREGGEAAAGFIFGTGEGISGMAGDMVAGMILIGDLRDILKNLCYLWPGGEDPDWVNFGLAVAGLVLDVGEIFSAGMDTPANFFVSFVKVLLKQDGLNKKVARIFVELLMLLIREWRAALRGGVFLFTAYSLYTVVKDLTEFMMEGLSLGSFGPKKILETVETLKTRFEILMELFSNSAIQMMEDIPVMGRFLKRLREGRLTDDEIRDLVRYSKLDEVSTEVIRVMAKVIDVYPNWKGMNLTPRQLRGLGEFLQSHGPNGVHELLKRFHAFSDPKPLQIVLGNIEAAARCCREIKGDDWVRPFKDMTVPLTQRAWQKQGAFHELDVLSRYFHRLPDTNANRIVDIQPRWNGKQGVDFIIQDNDGRLYMLEVKSFFALDPSNNSAKLHTQFNRYIDNLARLDALGPRSPMPFRWVFRGEYEAEYWESLLATLAKAGKLPDGVQISAHFLGLEKYR